MEAGCCRPFKDRSQGRGSPGPWSLRGPLPVPVLSVVCPFRVKLPLQLWALAPPCCPER